MRNRKFIVFIISIAAILFLSVINKPDAFSSIVALNAAFYTAITIQKNEHFKENK